MSRAGLCSSLLAAVAAALLVSCVPGSRQRSAYRAPRTPVRIDFSCGGAVPTISLTDNAGNPAWVVETQNRDIAWRPAGNHITINSIVAKPGKTLPIDADSDEHGGSGGRPYKAKVKSGHPNDPQIGDVLSYSIDVTCQQNGNTVRLVIDPEMIVR